MFPDGPIRHPGRATVNICRNATRALQCRSLASTRAALPLCILSLLMKGAATPRGLKISSVLRQLCYQGSQEQQRGGCNAWLVGQGCPASATQLPGGHGHVAGPSWFGAASRCFLGSRKCLLRCEQPPPPRLA